MVIHLTESYGTVITDSPEKQPPTGGNFGDIRRKTIETYKAYRELGYAKKEIITKVMNEGNRSLRCKTWILSLFELVEGDLIPTSLHRKLPLLIPLRGAISELSDMEAKGLYRVSERALSKLEVASLFTEDPNELVRAIKGIDPSRSPYTHQYLTLLRGISPLLLLSAAAIHVLNLELKIRAQYGVEDTPTDYYHYPRGVRFHFSYNVSQRVAFFDTLESIPKGDKRVPFTSLTHKLTPDNALGLIMLMPVYSKMTKNKSRMHSSTPIEVPLNSLFKKRSLNTLKRTRGMYRSLLKKSEKDPNSITEELVKKTFPYEWAADYTESRIRLLGSEGATVALSSLLEEIEIYIRGVSV